MMFRTRRPTLWIAAAAVLALGVGLAIAYRQVGVPQPRQTRSAAPADTGEQVIEEALGQIPVDSVAFKTRWIDELTELDLASLRPAQREILVRFANAEQCTCGCGYTLATCRINDPTCPSSLPRLEALMDSVRTGKIRNADGLRVRPTEIPPHS